jgi:hypothetical protein
MIVFVPNCAIFMCKVMYLFATTAWTDGQECELQWNASSAFSGSRRSIDPRFSLLTGWLAPLLVSHTALTCAPTTTTPLSCTLLCPTTRRPRITHHGRRTRVATREDLARQKSHRMAAEVALRSFDGLAEWEEALGGSQTACRRQVAVTVANEAPHKQLEGAAGCRNGW